MEAVISQLIIGIVYSSIIVSLIWARFRFFKITTKKSKLVSYLNDPAVLVQIGVTYGLLWQSENISLLATFCVLIAYLLSLTLFWWAIRTAGDLDFASSDVKGQIFTTGAFGLVRHPFYLSYMIVWLTSSSLFGSIYLWASCLVLIGIYVYSARQEERSIIEGAFSIVYQDYKTNVPMLFPFSHFF